LSLICSLYGLYPITHLVTVFILGKLPELTTYDSLFFAEERFDYWKKHLENCPQIINDIDMVNLFQVISGQYILLDTFPKEPHERRWSQAE